MRPLIIAHARARSSSPPEQSRQYGALLCGVLCLSAWALLASRHVPAHAALSSLPWVSSSGRGVSATASGKAWPLSRQASPLHQLLNDVGPHVRAAAAGGNATAPASRLLVTFQRARTAMPFLMATCRMCGSAVAADMEAGRLHAPVASTLLESALSNTPAEARVVVDVGAGLGYFSMLAAAWGAKVVAFEPRDWPRQLLDQNAALVRDGRLKVVPYAAGNATALPQQQQGGAAAPEAKAGAAAAPQPVVRLSEAIAGGVPISLLLINGSCAGEPSLPGVREVVAGAEQMLPRVQWLFLRSLCDDGDRLAMAGMLQRALRAGNFSHAYSFSEAPEEAAQQQQASMLEQPGEQQREAAGGVREQAGTDARGVRGSYPAEARFVDVTELVAAGDAGAASAQHYVLSRQPMGHELTITMPAPVVFAFDLAQQQALQQQQQQQQQQAAAAAAAAAVQEGANEPAQAPSPGDPPEVPVTATA